MASASTSLRTYSSASIIAELRKRGVYFEDGRIIDISEANYSSAEISEELARRGKLAVKSAPETYSPPINNGTIESSTGSAQLSRVPPLADWTTAPPPRHPIRGTPHENNSHILLPAQNPASEYLRQRRAYEKLRKLSPEELLAKAQSKGGEDARNFLIKRYHPLVDSVALKLKKRLPISRDIDDLISAGREGLMDAIRNYDSSRNSNFVSYARPRVFGAILD